MTHQFLLPGYIESDFVRFKLEKVVESQDEGEGVG